ncbi:MAG TPA: hypothetical protein VJS64_07320 [Pyrinomonadaceae bacterium]|nr:hypothetical protein [Pyrinomonadaceae bacterium]
MNVKRCEKLVAAFISVIAALGLAQGREFICVSTSTPPPDFIPVATVGEQAQLFDRFGDVALKDEKILLDNLVKKLGGDKTSKIYIIVYGKRGGRAGEAKGRADRAKNYLIRDKYIASERIETKYTCLRTKLEFELWVIPSNVTRRPPCTTK